MRVMVTGHRGYIGAVLVPMLVEAGHEVVGLDSNWFADCPFGEPLEFPLVKEIHKDIRDVEVADFEGCEAVLHLAGLSNDPLGNIDAGLTEEINEKASIRVAELAKEAGVERFLFSSSCSTYGAAGEAFLDENASFNPVTPYGISKVKMEQALAAMADDNFSPTYLRNATAYGVSPLLRVDLVLNNLVAWAYLTGRIYLMSDGTPWRPVVHIEDISRAFLAVLSVPRSWVHDQPFNVGRTDQNYQIIEIAEIVSEVVPDCRIEIAEGAGPDKRSYRVNCDKLARELTDFEPKWDVRRGAQELYEAYRENKLTKEDFEGPRYIRLAKIKQLISDGRLGNDLRWR